MGKRERSQIDDMLSLLRDGLRNFVEINMARRDGDRWRQEFAKRQNKSNVHIDDDDVALYLNVLISRSQDLFDRYTADDAVVLARELRSLRNKWAHQEEFTPEDVYRAWDSAERLLALVNAPQTEKAAQCRQEAMMRLTPDLRNELYNNFAAKLDTERQKRIEVQRQYDEDSLQWEAQQRDLEHQLAEVQLISQRDLSQLTAELESSRRELDTYKLHAQELDADLADAKRRLNQSEEQSLQQGRLAQDWQQRAELKAQEVARLEEELKRASALVLAADRRSDKLADRYHALRTLTSWNKFTAVGIAVVVLAVAAMAVIVDRKVLTWSAAPRMETGPSVVALSPLTPSGTSEGSYRLAKNLVSAPSGAARPTDTATPRPTATATPTLPPTLTPTRTATPTPTQFTYPTLAYNFDTRRGEGWELYKRSLLGTVVTWTGKVADFGWFNTDVMVDVGQNDWQRDVALELSDVREIKRLKKGDMITFTGTLSSLDVPFGILGLKTRLKNVDILEITQPIEQAATPKP